MAEKFIIQEIVIFPDCDKFNLISADVMLQHAIRSKQDAIDSVDIDFGNKTNNEDFLNKEFAKTEGRIIMADSKSSKVQRIDWIRRN